MIRQWPMLHLLALLPLASAMAQASRDTTRICVAPASVEANTGSPATMVDAVRETFTTFHTGASLGVAPLNARLASQVREEAKLAGCRYLLLTTVKHQRKSSGGSSLRRMARSWWSGR